MRRIRGRSLALGLTMAAVTACAVAGGPMPDVVGQPLDIALSQLGSAGLSENSVDIIGDGGAGILEKSGWTVCAQEPGAGTVDVRQPRLVVDRTCVDSLAPGVLDGIEDPDQLGEPLGEDVGGVLTMPDLAGEPLEAAIAYLEGSGEQVINLQDAAGLSRRPDPTSGWQVCSHEPGAGTLTMTGQMITVWATRLDEVCV